MAPAHSVIIAGAGIGGLTAALALAQHGFGVTIFDQAQKLEEIGAGIQLSPNASRILIGLGLANELQRHVVAPEELRILDARTARVLVRAPLGAAAEQRYGAPYWVIHRGDLQAVLIEAARTQPGIVFHLGSRVEDFTFDVDGVAIVARSAARDFKDRGAATIARTGADHTELAKRARISSRSPLALQPASRHSSRMIATMLISLPPRTG